MRRAALALGLLALAFVALTWIALESGGVAVVETHRADGTVRETRVWFVERDGALWLEAGAPENGWFVDVGGDPRLRIRTEGVWRETFADLVPEESERVRAALRAKYGWRDAWVGLLVDSTRSVAVRLHEADQRE